MEYNRQRDLAISENVRANLEGKILKQIDDKTWVYCNPDEDPKYKKIGWMDETETIDWKTRNIKVQVDSMTFKNVRLAAEHLKVDYMFLYKRLQYMRNNNIENWTKNGKTVKMKFI